MPLMKFYVDASLGPQAVEKMTELLPSIQQMICKQLSTHPNLCQFSVIQIRGLSDQAKISVEAHIMPSTERTRERLLSVFGELKQYICSVQNTTAAIRVTTLEPENYIAIR